MARAALLRRSQVELDNTSSRRKKKLTKYQKRYKLLINTLTFVKDFGWNCRKKPLNKP